MNSRKRKEVKTLHSMYGRCMKLKVSTRSLLFLLALLAVLILIGYLLLPTLKRGYFSPEYNGENSNTQWQISEYANGFEVPWDIQFSSNGELFVTERAGKVKVVRSNSAVDTIAQLSNVYSVGESGLTGIALHPQFESNGFIYLYYTYREAGTSFNRVSRFKYKDNGLSDEQVILNNLAGGSIHNGGRMAFGPDGKLWVLTGDAAQPSLAQKADELEGKVLRLNEDGSVPNDNPISGSLVYSLGHRNPQGLDWHPLTGELFVSSHGELAYDEINHVKANSNHGWPLYKKCNEPAPFVPAVLCSNNETWAPSGVAFYGSDSKQLESSLFFVGLRSGLLERLEIVDNKVEGRETLIKGKYGRLRAIARGPDASLYITTSNRDGRGSPQAGDDKILKVTPVK